jgi:hypothetical protein
MVAMVISSLLVGVALSVTVRMTSAYRTQTEVAALQQSLRSARELIVRDVRRAGYRITRLRTATGAFGTTTATDLPPVMVLNAADDTGADEIRIFYGDASTSATVTAMTPTRDEVTVDDASAFAVGDVVVVSALTLVALGGELAPLAEYDACAVEITDIAGATVTFASTEAPYNTIDNPQCTAVAARLAAAADTTMLPLVARAYRVDPGREAVSVLQVSRSGNLDPEPDWEDLAAGATDLQFATRYYEDGDAVDLDDDGDATRDWYSAEGQETPDETGARPANAVPVNVSVSVAMRTPTDVSGVTSASTPAFIDDTSVETVEHNRYGDAPAIDLATVAVASRPARHRGNYIYRGTTSTVDLRNVGVGR